MKKIITGLKVFGGLYVFVTVALWFFIGISLLPDKCRKGYSCIQADVELFEEAVERFKKWI